MTTDWSVVVVLLSYCLSSPHGKHVLSTQPAHALRCFPNLASNYITLVCLDARVWGAVRDAEAVLRSSDEAEVNDEAEVLPEHVESIMPQLLLDF